MKAEQRHQLQKNVLASQMTKLWDGGKTSGSMIWGVLLVIVLLGFAYWWLTGTSANRISAEWTNWWDRHRFSVPVQPMPDNKDFEEQFTEQIKSLNKEASEFQGSAASSEAQLMLGDQLYELGYQTSFAYSPKDAAKPFKLAYEVYEGLSRTASNREISLRALIGAARCQESLGDAKKAAEIYSQIVKHYGTEFKGPGPDGVLHPLLADAQQRIDSLSAGAGQAFYQEGGGWPQRLPPSSKATGRPFGEIPPPPGHPGLPDVDPTNPDAPPPPLERPTPPPDGTEKLPDAPPPPAKP